jgi:hypothetical protein
MACSSTANERLALHRPQLAEVPVGTTVPLLSLSASGRKMWARYIFVASGRRGGKQKCSRSGSRLALWKGGRRKGGGGRAFPPPTNSLKSVQVPVKHVVIGGWGV